MSKNIIIIILALVVIGGGAYFYQSNQNQSSPSNNGQSQTATESDQTSPQAGQATPVSTDESGIPSNWQSRTSAEHNYTISYPPNMLYEEQTPLDRYVMLGETQRTGTEVYDGIILNITSGSYTQASLGDFVIDLHDERKSSDNVSDITDITAAQVAGLEGYQFSATGLGTFTYIYLPAGRGEYLELIYLLEDPESVGYRQTLDTIFSSLELE